MQKALAHLAACIAQHGLLAAVLDAFCHHSEIHVGCEVEQMSYHLPGRR